MAKARRLLMESARPAHSHNRAPVNRQGTTKLANVMKIPIAACGTAIDINRAGMPRKMPQIQP